MGICMTEYVYGHIERAGDIIRKCDQGFVGSYQCRILRGQLPLLPLLNGPTVHIPIHEYAAPICILFVDFVDGDRGGTAERHAYRVALLDGRISARDAIAILMSRQPQSELHGVSGVSAPASPA